MLPTVKDRIAAKSAFTSVLTYSLVTGTGLLLLFYFNCAPDTPHTFCGIHYLQDFLFYLLSCSFLFILTYKYICQKHIQQQHAITSEKRYHSLFNNMNEGGIVCQPINGGSDFMVIDINCKGEEIDETCRKIYLGKKISELPSSNISQELINAVYRVYSTGIPERCPVVRYAGCNLERYRNNFLFRLETQEVVIIYNDITAKKCLEEELKQSKRELILQNKIITKFLITDNSRVLSQVITLISQSLQSTFGMLAYVNHREELTATILNDRHLQWHNISIQKLYSEQNVSSKLLQRAIRDGVAEIHNSEMILPTSLLALQNGIAVPVLSGDKSIGVLFLGNRKEPFTDNERQLLERICSYLAPILKARLQVQHNKALHDKAVRRLQKNEATLKEAEKLAKIGNWEHDFNSGFFSCSDEVYRILGIDTKRSKCVVEFKEAIRLIHPDDRKGVISTYRDAITKHLPYDRVNRIILHDKTEKVIHSRSITSYDENSRPIRSLGTIQDITTKVKAEVANKRLATAIDQAVDVIVITDRTGIIQYVNPAFEKITGYSRDEITGKTPKVLKSNEHPDSYYKNLWETITAGKVWRGRFINKNKSGNIFTEEASITPVFSDSGKIINFVAVKHDISRELELEQQLRQAVKMEAMGTLASGIAHDFNNILGAILGYTRMAMEELQSDSQPYQDLCEVIHSGDRAVNLVKQILLFSRHQEQSLVPVQVEYLVKEATKMLRATLPATISLEANIAPNCPAIMADPSQIHQIIINLCTNAKQSMIVNGGTLSISLSQKELHKNKQRRAADINPGFYIVLSVEDTGHGITKKNLTRIFDPFFTTKGIGEGTGLGLAVVHGIVSSHHGNIFVESTVNKGTKFTIFFPAASPGAPSAQNEDTDSVPRGNEHIMVVDDEANILTLRRRLLTKLGYQVSTFSRSADALTSFMKAPDDFDLILTDMDMPDLDGKRFADRILQRRPKTPIVLCTGHSEIINSHNAAEYGFKDLLEKPISQENLAKTLRKHLDSRL